MMSGVRHKIYVRRTGGGLGYGQAYRLIRNAVRAALDAEGVDEPCVVNVLLTDDKHICRINREFRDIDRATDVLSFPMNELCPGNFDGSCAERDPESGEILLGDMVISLEHADAQGREFGHGFDREVSYLTVHSVLHLLGYDHMDEAEEKRLMRSREKIIMETIGL